jgi:ribosomal protein S18 acetylase RimI-like enzyme
MTGGLSEVKGQKVGSDPIGSEDPEPAFELRSATAADSQQLGALSSATYRTTYTGMFSKDSWLDFATPEYFQRQWNSDLTDKALEVQGPEVVAVVGDRVVGFGAGRWRGERGDAYAELPDDAFCEITELYVHADYQDSKYKLGRRLLNAIVSKFDDEKMVVGHAARKNDRISRYLERLGAERKESGRIILFRATADGGPFEVDVGRRSFYWKVSDLKKALAKSLE